MSQHLYNKENTIIFCKTKEAYGGLSNMAGGYPIRMGDMLIKTSEHLYQALKYIDPAIQMELVSIASPMGAKMFGKKFVDKIRPDWEKIKFPVMDWCINLKLLNNIKTFGALLCSLDDSKEIVELSYEDNYWGAIPTGQSLYGCNTLGRLLTVLSRKHKTGYAPHTCPIIDIPDFLFNGKDAVTMSMDGLKKLENILT
jgi:predicted NAD-dependent protein-ADP-ribosyltransferase YbiA (DUF1768 family)